jgi:hypothetical protein
MLRESGFSAEHFERLLPLYLVSTEKQRLKEGLSQFLSANRDNDIVYDHFYLEDNVDFFRQSDLIAEVRSANWNADFEGGEFERSYTDSMLLSNTCDVNDQNKRPINIKESVFAPVVNFREYLRDLKENGISELQAHNFEKDVMQQRIANLFYLPPYIKDGPDYIALLDRLFWLPSSDLNKRLPYISQGRIKSLDQFGFYLFIFKLSYHFCRLPEEADR